MCKRLQVELFCPMCKSKIDESNQFFDWDWDSCEICHADFEARDDHYIDPDDDADPEGSDEIDVALQFEDVD